MHAALRAMQAGHNALLESPTGTGKTLALLIATLAYQHRARAEVVLEKAADDAEREAAARAVAARAAAKDAREGAAARAALAARAAGAGGVKVECAGTADAVVKLEGGTNAAISGAAVAAAAEPAPAPAALPALLEAVEAVEAGGGGGGGGGGLAPSSSPPPAAPRVLKSLRGPRIIYTSRTHSQLAQVARELHKCGYYTRGVGHDAAAFCTSGMVDPIAFLRASRPGALPPFAPAALPAAGVGGGAASAAPPPPPSPPAREEGITSIVPPYFQATTLASRSHYCVNPAANRSSAVQALHEELEQLRLNARRARGGAAGDWAALGLGPLQPWAELAKRVELPSEADVNEACLCLTKRVKGTKEVNCPYYGGADGLAAALKQPPLMTWDIEDATALGVGLNGKVAARRCSGGGGGGGGGAPPPIVSSPGCPYFAAKAAYTEASIVFLPYTYLLDPGVREAIGLDLEGSIVVVDEAHNIEDACREAASGEWERETLLKLARSLIDAGVIIESAHHALLGQNLRLVVNWLERVARELGMEELWGEEGGRRGGGGGGGGRPLGGTAAGNGDDRYHTWEGELMMAHLREMGLSLEKYAETMQALVAVVTDAEAELTEGRAWSEEEKAPAMDTGPAIDPSEPQRLSSLALSYEGGVGGGVGALPAAARGDKPRRKRSDFNNKTLAPLKKLLSVMGFLLAPPLKVGAPPNHEHYRLVVLPEKKPQDPAKPRNGARMCLWCLSAAPAFGAVSSMAHSVLLTSGTLSPLSSFASELGADFPTQLQGVHAIKALEQVWAGVSGKSWDPCQVALVNTVGDPRSPWRFHLTGVANLPGAAGAAQALPRDHAFPFLAGSGGGAPPLPTHFPIPGITLNGSRSALLSDGAMDRYLDGVGVAVLSVACRTPGGVLVFFPSFRLLSDAVKRWRSRSCRVPVWRVGAGGAYVPSSQTLWEALGAVKEMFHESSGGGRPPPARGGAPSASQGGEEEAAVAAAAAAFESEPHTAMLASFRAAVAAAAADESLSLCGGARLGAGGGGRGAAAPLPAAAAGAAAAEPRPLLPARRVFSSTTFGGASAAFFRGAGGRSEERSSPEPAPVPSATTGALLMAVCRGKCAEGIDFANNDCRAVVVVSIPFPNLGSPQVVLKRQYCDARVRAHAALAAASPSGGGGGGVPPAAYPVPAAAPISGSEWYKQQAFRALNQAIGRTVRHRHDYGAMVLLDERYSDTDNLASVSKWVQPVVRHHGGMGMPPKTAASKNPARTILAGVAPATMASELDSFFVHLSYVDPSGKELAGGRAGCSCSTCSYALAMRVEAPMDDEGGGVVLVEEDAPAPPNSAAAAPPLPASAAAVAPQPPPVEVAPQPPPVCSAALAMFGVSGAQVQQEAHRGRRSGRRNG